MDTVQLQRLQRGGDMRVLITGGAGFIGSFLAEAYLEQGEEVYIIDDLSTGSLENIKHLVEHRERRDRLHVTIESVLNQEAMIELVGTCDLVVHLAAAVGVQYILDNPLASMTTNIGGTENDLRVCKKVRKQVLIAAASEGYGKHEEEAPRETNDCTPVPPGEGRGGEAAAAPLRHTHA